MSLATVSAQLKLDISDFAAKLTQASGSIGKFARETNKSYGTATAALRTHTMELKSTARIVQGIMVSQAFYTMARGIREATASLMEFNEQLDYMQVTYSALFGNTNIADDFMRTLQEHSINTIFEFGELADASKKLLAYGIEYENLMFVMEGLTNLGAMSGDSAAIERAARAVGQIFTKGTLKAEEMKQLADAYIPIYEIVQSSFGLTDEQMSRVGDLKLPAHDVINAIIDYANDSFGDVADAAMLTITGLKNRIVDTFKVLGHEMMAPLTIAFKSFLVFVDKNLAAVRETFNQSGFGGVFESLVPDPHTQEIIRRFIANVRNMFMSLASVLTVVGTAAKEIFVAFMTAFNIVQPIITAMVNILAMLVQSFLQTSFGAAALRVAAIAAAGALAILVAQTIRATVVSVLTALINNLSKALLILSAVITKHPIVLILLGIAGALAGIAVSSKSANNAITGLFDTLSGATGSKTHSDVLQKVVKDTQSAESAADRFNNRLGESTEAADKLGDAVDKAGKAGKKASRSLLSFDEVFRLNEPDNSGAGAGVGAGLLDGLDGLMEGLGGLGDALIPDIPDFTEFIDGFTSSLFGGLKDSILGVMSGGMGFNTLLGGALGMVKAIAKAFGGAIKQLPSLIKGSSFKEVIKNIAGLLKGTGLKELAKGGLIGAAIGFLVDGIAALLWNTLADKFSLSEAAEGHAKIGQNIGAIIGTIIGGILGGPAGALIGSAIGTFAGGFVGLFWEKISEYLSPLTNVITDFVTTTAQGFSKWWNDSITGFTAWFKESKDGFIKWFSETTDSFFGWIGETLGGLFGWIGDTIALFSDWDNITSETLATWWNDTKSGFYTWLYDTLGNFALWAFETATAFNNWAVETRAKFTEWVVNTFASFVKWVNDVRNKFNEWRNDILTVIGGFCIAALKAFAAWISDVVNAFAEWYSNILYKVIAFKADAIATIKSFCSNALQAFITWCSDTTIAIIKWFVDLLKTVKEKWQGLWNPKGWSTGWSLVKEWFTDLFNDIKDWFDDLSDKVSRWWKNLWKDKKASVDVSGSVSTSGSLGGHATGGIFTREHIARFAEGNKAEAVIPLENASAMQPFVNAISQGILEGLAPTMLQANTGNGQNLPPMYVGTLIADDRGIKQLYNKFRLIQVQENARTGITT